MTEFGEIASVDIRKIWPNEATDFTPWLVENIERLGSALGMDIEVQEREAGVGDFSLDIRAKDLGSGRTIVIENQLTQTDHDHLGKRTDVRRGPRRRCTCVGRQGVARRTPQGP